MPRTPAQCAGRAVKSNLLSFGADALGAIPGEGQVLAGAQLAAAGVGFVNGLVTKDAAGAAGSIVGGQFGVTGLKAIPVLGNLLSAGFAVRDIANGISDYQACLAGH